MLRRLLSCIWNGFLSPELAAAPTCHAAPYTGSLDWATPELQAEYTGRILPLEYHLEEYLLPEWHLLPTLDDSGSVIGGTHRPDNPR